MGIYICEAFAAGRPVVEPARGSFPEIVDGAGLLCEGDDASSLARYLEEILLDADLFARCRERARDLSRTRYSGEVMARQLENLYQSIK